VSRKPNPENIYLARRAAHFGRLTRTGRLDELDAEHWLSAWEREAEARGLDRHFSDVLGRRRGLDRGAPQGLVATDWAA
jgi:hypothetical protein